MPKYTKAENIKYYASLPRKHMSVGVLFFNNKNELLIVKPNYKNHWLVVGGTVDALESPRQAIIREIKEEINLSFNKPRPICIEYKLNKGFQGDAIHMLFYGGILTQTQIDSIKLQKSELDYYKFVSLKSAAKILNQTAGNKIAHCQKAIKNKEIIYLENGEKIK